jgi:hypothetical protein
MAEWRCKSVIAQQRVNVVIGHCHIGSLGQHPPQLSRWLLLILDQNESVAFETIAEG